MRNALLILTLLLAGAGPAAAQIGATVKPLVFWGDVPTTDVWRREPREILGIVPGKALGEQTAGKPCRLRTVPSTGERVLDAEDGRFCTTNAPFYSSFQNAPDLGFPYDVSLLLKKETVEGVQFSLAREHGSQALRYLIATYGPPTYAKAAKSKEYGWDTREGRIYTWAGEHFFLTFSESGVKGRSAIAMVTNAYIDKQSAASKKATTRG